MPHTHAPFVSHDSVQESSSLKQVRVGYGARPNGHPDKLERATYAHIQPANRTGQEDLRLDE